jgi:hypothetical protein
MNLIRRPPQPIAGGYRNTLLFVVIDPEALHFLINSGRMEKERQEVKAFAFLGFLV